MSISKYTAALLLMLTPFFSVRSIADNQPLSTNAAGTSTADTNICAWLPRDAYKLAQLPREKALDASARDKAFNDFEEKLQNSESFTADAIDKCTSAFRNAENTLRQAKSLYANEQDEPSRLQAEQYSGRLEQSAKRVSAVAKSWGLVIIEEPVYDWTSDYIVNIFGGIEGATVSQFKSKAITRMGVDFYEPSFFAPKNDMRVGGWSTIKLTSSAEKTGSNCGTDKPSESDCPQDNAIDKIKPTISAEIGTFFDIARGVKPENHKGIIIYSGLVKSDEEDRFTKRYYIGYRGAWSPGQYLDLAYGKTEGVSGHRMELRGQLPLTTIPSYGTIWGGVVFNFGVDKSKDAPDSVSIYLQWQGSFSEFLPK